MSAAEMKTVIADDVEVVGSIKCASNIQIDGKLNGDLNCSGDALLGNSCAIKGNINVKCTVINGQVNGNVNAKDKIDLKSSARITGDLRAKRLTMEDGVTFIGKAEITPSSPANKPGESIREISPEDANADESAEKKGFLKK